MIPYGKQSINKDDISEVIKVLKSPFLTTGPKITEFEKELTKKTGTKYAVCVNNGTAALHLAYLSAEIKKNDEVITTPNTFAATTNMLLLIDAKPIFVDIRKDTYNIDENLIEKSITKKTKAIVPVHFAGHPCNMSAIWKIAKKHNLIVIEDAAHALGAKYENQYIGNGKSDMVTFSFHPVKSITTGEGGAILTNNKKYYEKLKLLRSHGIIKDKNGFNKMVELGYNYRLTDIQASLGISQLKRLDNFIKARHNIAELYKKELSSIPQIILPEELKNFYSSWHLYIIRVKNKKDRLPLYKYLLKNGIGVNFHYPCVYKHPYYQKNGFKNLKCPVAEEYAETAITIPLFPSLTKKEIKYIADKLKFFFKTNFCQGFK